MEAIWRPGQSGARIEHSDRETGVSNRLNSVICDADTVNTGYSAPPDCSGYVMHGSARRLILALLAAHLAATGCSRKFFRNQADKDVAGVITQKNRFPAWEVKN